MVPLPYNGNQSNKSTTKMYRTECHTVWAPFRGNAGGMGAFDGPFSLGRGRPLFPRKAGRASFLAIVVTNPLAQGRPVTSQTGPTRTEGQTALSQEGGQSELSRNHWVTNPWAQGRPGPARPGPAAIKWQSLPAVCLLLSITQTKQLSEDQRFDVWLRPQLCRKQT